MGSNVSWARINILRIFRCCGQETDSRELGLGAHKTPQSLLCRPWGRRALLSQNTCSCSCGGSNTCQDHRGLQGTSER